MRTRNLTPFSRIGILIFTLITALGLIFMGITYISTTQFYQASTQLLNKDVAAHIAKFSSPFEPAQFNREKADSVFYNAMVISPSIEVYFLDTAGTVIYYHAADSAIRLRKLPLRNIRRHIAQGGKDYIKGLDPRDPGNPKIFSAAEILLHNRQIGYIYVILGSNEYRSVSEMFLQSHVGSLVLRIIALIIILSVIISILYTSRLQKRFNRVISVLQQYQQGNLEMRFRTDQPDEFAPVSQAFNQMADLLQVNFDKLKNAEKERKGFIANISHDLRTPLSVARGFAETLLVKGNDDKTDKAEQALYTKQVLTKIAQIENMVSQLFELSKMESPQFQPAKEPFVFSEVLQEIVNASAPAARKKGLQLDCLGCENPSWIFADIRMIERVVQNLLDNAIKYTPQNGLIQIELIRSGQTLLVQCKNWGEPLDKKLADWINETTSTAENAVRPVGSGLGLTIVKKILNLHGFRFRVETGDTPGNCFIIEIDVYHPPVTAAVLYM